MKHLFPKITRKDLWRYVANSWAVSWPMALIMFFEFLLSIVDVYIAGKIGKEVQAAYGFVMSLYFILVVVAIALSVGSVSITARLFSAGKKEELGTAVYSSFVTAFVTGTVLGLLGVFVMPLIIMRLAIPPEVKAYVVPLIRVYSIGLIFHYALITSNALLRACNLVRRSLKTMARICILNVILNFTFVFYTPLGYRGIAASTALSVLIGCVLNGAYIKKLLPKKKQYSFAVARNVFSIGWPIGLLQVLWQLGTTVIFMILSTLPVHAVETMAAFTNGMRIESAIFLPAFAFNMANAVVVGNLLGSDDREEAFRNGIITGVLGVIIVSTLTALVLINAPGIARLVSHNPIVIRESVNYLFVVLMCEPVMAWAVILSGGLNGAGDTKSVLVRVSLSVWLIRIPLGLLFIRYFQWGATSMWWAMNASIVVHSIFITKRYFSKRWLPS